MMNYGPPPPPPPPPFATGAPPVRLPSEIAAATAAAARNPVPTMQNPQNLIAPPKALAGAMMKDRKPFTYTPGGLNLAEINAQQQPDAPQQLLRGHPVDPNQSKSFRVIQSAYGGDNQPIPLATGMPQEQPVLEPKKYTGSSIPSRSFRMLQAMTDTEDVLQTTDDGKPEDSRVSKSENHRLSSSSSSMQNKPDNESLIAPSYTNTNDSFVYRQVAPKLLKSNPQEERVVNSALSSKRSNGVKQWPTVICSNSNSPSRSGSASSDLNSTHSPENLRQKLENSENNHDCKMLYEGSHIPSRVFRHLQNNTSSPEEVPIPRLMNQLNINKITDDDSNSLTSSSNFDSSEDSYRNRVIETVSQKESVLKQLTSQFDPQVALKKPRAAPGRVFRYLQETYGDEEIAKTSSQSSGSSSPVINSSTENSNYEMEPKPYGGGRIPGRTFRMLQENYEDCPSVLQARK